MQKLLSSVKTLACKSTSAVAFGLQKGQTATALLTRCKAHAAAFVSVVSAGCLVHFLTLVSNYSISQRASIARDSFLLCPCAWILFAAFVSVVSSSFPVSACKVINYKPNVQIFYVKKYETLKNSCFLSKKATSVMPYIIAFFEKLIILYNKVLKKYLVKSCKSLAYKKQMW